MNCAFLRGICTTAAFRQHRNSKAAARFKQ